MHEHWLKVTIIKRKKIIGVNDVLKEDGGGSSVRVINDNLHMSHEVMFGKEC
jgi:hypothetical protein